ncbi:MAG TPA: hypothetical protein VH170_09355 [Chthoniobacterales bacterium]|jgi:A/G-specific adenine glycosylase|nr:hypothetical protein [Chthoniobacterales bacterium]
MLQQTQVVSVLPYYKKWLLRFPTFAALARSSETEALHAWQGLGYYARARNLHATAKMIVDQYRGRFPAEIAKMEKLPGIGKYTAHAIATFAFDQAVPIVEANTARVLSRLFNLRTPIDSTRGQRSLWNYAASIVPKKAAAIYNSGLLDLGALVCLPRNPKCSVCPVRIFCRAKNPDALPMKRARPQVKRLVEKHGLSMSGSKVLLEKSLGRWRGMWILPRLNGNSKGSHAIYRAAFPFTNHQITLKVHRAQCDKIDVHTQRWFSKRALNQIPMPSPHRRAINALLN